MTDISQIFDHELIEELARKNLCEVGTAIVALTDQEPDPEAVAKDVDTIIQGAWDAFEVDPHRVDVCSVLRNWADKEECYLQAEITQVDGGVEDLVFYFNDKGEVVHEPADTYFEDDEDEDDYMDSLCAQAFEISEDEGRPFDHVMGELLGGVR